MIVKQGDLEEANVPYRTSGHRDMSMDHMLLNHADAEKRKAQEYHLMKCPKCGMKLVEVDYKNIKVDKCSACQGVWLDTGEMVTLMMKVARTRSKI